MGINVQNSYGAERILALVGAVRPSVCLSQAGAVLQQMNVG